MTANNVFDLRMTDAEYDRQREELRHLYGDSNIEAAAKRDQALADLFRRSHWTQEQLAKKEGKTQQWVANRLRFGRFLNFTTTVVNADILPANLTEGRFRQFWAHTDKMGGNEGQRFAAVLKEIRAANVQTRSPVNTGLSQRIADKFSDGQWHDEEMIRKHFAREDPEAVRGALGALGWPSRQICNVRGERERRGSRTIIRMFKQDRLISLSEIQLKLCPLIEGLKEEGKKNHVTISIGSVARLAALLQRRLDEWAQDPAANQRRKQQEKDDD